MAPEMFQTIVKQLPPSTLIQLAGYGEPFLNKHLESFVRYADAQGRPNIEIYTNFGAVDETRIRGLLDVPFKRLVISLDAMSKEAFQVYKGCNQFDLVFRNIKILSDEKSKRRNTTQQLVVQMVVTKKNIDQVTEFERAIREMGLIPATKTLNTHAVSAPKEKVAEFEVEALTRYPAGKTYSRGCSWIWAGMIVFWNGDVSICCRDPMGKEIYGNVQDHALADLMNKERKRFRQSYFADPGTIQICRNCSSA
jgi:sulfatase maturation enzyme AslB (radical SAM superfamily)